MKSAVLFDIDGVLLDSVKANAKFYRELLGHFGHRGPSDEEMRLTNHLALADGIRHFAPGIDAEEFQKILAYESELEAGYDLLEMPAEAPAVIETLAKKYLLGLVSNRTRLGYEEFFRFSKLKDFFTAIAAYEDTVEHKPHPEPLLFVAKQLGVEPQNCVFVGDALTDIQAAKAAGMKMILYAAEALPGADVTLNHFSDLLKAVERLV